MADAIVGRLSIKVKPDSTGFKKKAEADLKKQGDIEVQAKVVADSTGLNQEVERAAERAERGAKVEVDVEANQKSLETSVDRLAKKIKGESIELAVGADRGALKRSLDYVQAQLAKITTPTIEVNLDPDSLMAAQQMLEENLAAATEEPRRVEFEFGNDETSLRRALAEINREMSSITNTRIEVEADEGSLAKAKAEIERRLHDVE